MRIGEKSPAFKLQDLKGKNVKLSDYKDKAVLIEFWSTWCPPCLKSIPHLNEINEKYHDKGLAVVGITLDDHNSHEKVKQFAEEFEIKYKILFSDTLTKRVYGISTIPVIYLINREHIVSKKFTGYTKNSKKEIIKHIEELI